MLNDSPKKIQQRLQQSRTYILDGFMRCSLFWSLSDVKISEFFLLQINCSHDFRFSVTSLGRKINKMTSFVQQNMHKVGS